MNFNGLFRIGDMARLFHLSVSSIRHYENAGLLTPEYTDPSTGYRYYSTRQFETFNTIRYLRALDMPLCEIADFMQNRDIKSIENKLRQQKQSVAKKKDELAKIERKIDNRLRQLSDARSAELGRIHTAVAPSCTLITVRQAIKISSYLDMELPISKLTESQAEALVFLGKVGVSISAEHLTDGCFDQYDSVFLVLDDEDDFCGKTVTLPEMLCVRVRFRGSHPQAPGQYRLLCRYIRENGLVISGDSREITMIDYGITNDTEQFVTEISIPVKRGDNSALNDDHACTSEGST